jgi:RNA-binding protein
MQTKRFIGRAYRVLLSPAMKKLTGAERKYLRGQAHSLKPLVRIGKQGLTEGALHEIDAALDSHELIKVHAPGTKEEKQDLAQRVEQATKATAVGQIGHVLIFYRQQADPEKRQIVVPESRGDVEEEALPVAEKKRAVKKPRRQPR